MNEGEKSENEYIMKGERKRKEKKEGNTFGKREVKENRDGRRGWKK